MTADVADRLVLLKDVAGSLLLARAAEGALAVEVTFLPGLWLVALDWAGADVRAVWDAAGLGGARHRSVLVVLRSLDSPEGFGSIGLGHKDIGEPVNQRLLLVLLLA